MAREADMQGNEFGRIGYVNIFISDFDRSLKFYREKLGLKPATQDASFGYAYFETEGISFAFAQTDDAGLVGAGEADDDLGLGLVLDHALFEEPGAFPALGM